MTVRTVQRWIKAGKLVNRSDTRKPMVSVTDVMDVA